MRHALTETQNHHSTDVLTGILLGCLCGIIAYRAQYRSVFDYRNNHLPLPYRIFIQKLTKHACLEPLFQRNTPSAALTDKNEPSFTTPDEYLAVRWPFPRSESCGPIDRGYPQTKKQHEPDLRGIDSRDPYMTSRQRGIDGDSGMNATWSMSRMSETDIRSRSRTTIDGPPKIRRTPATIDGSTDSSQKNRNYVHPRTSPEEGDMV